MKLVKDLTVEELISIIDKAVEKALIDNRVKKVKYWQRWTEEEFVEEIKDAFAYHKLPLTEENRELYRRFYVYWFKEEIGKGVNRLMEVDSWSTRARVKTFINRRDEENKRKRTF